MEVLLELMLVVLAGVQAVLLWELRSLLRYVAYVLAGFESVSLVDSAGGEAGSVVAWPAAGELGRGGGA